MVRIKRGLDIPIEGAPRQHISKGNEICHVALTGADFHGMKPAMNVTEGDEVKAGEVLFTDKKIPKIRYTSPASGKIIAINRGEKRVFQSIVIEKNWEEGLTFPVKNVAGIESLSREYVIDQLLNSGLWCALRTRPYSKVPDPDTSPHSIFVTAIDTRPLSAIPEIIIKEYKEDFTHGLDVLKRLVSGPLYLCIANDMDIPFPNAEKKVFTGPHPAGLPGTHIHFIDPVNRNKTVWHINYQDVIAIGKLFTIGHLWQKRIVSLAGPQVKNPRLVETETGACLSELTAGELKPGENRVISGSVLDGRHAVGAFDFLGRYSQQVTVLKEGRERSFLHYLSVGSDRFSVMPVYLSNLFKRKFSMTTTTNGSPRAMVPVGSYEKVMPHDILPTQLLRALIVGDIEMAENLGALELDEDDLALCTFVCPGKYEYGPILRDNLTTMEKEG